MRWILIVLVGLISSHNAHAQYRLVQGKVYSLFDPAWTVFNCNLEVVKINGDEAICRPFRVVSSTQTTRIAAANPHVAVTTTSSKEYFGGQIILLNDTSAFVGQELRPPIRAMKIEKINSASSARTGGIIDEPTKRRASSIIAYDMGVNYVPPAKQLTPEEQKIRDQNILEMKAKGFQFMQLEASNGVASAQYRLGMAYLKGDQVESNRYLAIEWLGKAALQGNEDAKAQLTLFQKPQTDTNSASTQ